MSAGMSCSLRNLILLPQTECPSFGFLCTVYPYGNIIPYASFSGFLGGSAVKNLLAMQETRVQSLGGEDTLEEGMATHSMENPMDRGAWCALVQRVAKSQTGLN